MKINIFYCWQSDLPRERNRDFIKNVLDHIKYDLRNESIEINIDEATNDLVGSPKLNQEILIKIQNADIFICDVSIINQNSLGRNVPNPNVMYELGFAVSSLGWERIILVFNQEFGLINNLPFDLEKHRLSIYKGVNPIDGDSLAASIKSKIKTIIQNSPTKGFLSPKAKILKIQYERDVENIKKFLGSFLTNFIDEHAEEAPKRINSDIHFFFDNFEKLLFNTANKFMLYDRKLELSIRRFYNYWRYSLPMDFVEYGYYNQHIDSYVIFSNPMDAPLNEEQDITWKRIRKNTFLMKKELNDILNYIHEKYIEVNIDSIQENLHQKWIENCRNS
ncbi:nucleotide-binding protein [Aliarcobacter butzleri]|uniref:nucleotide-binding protein n=1 Tax=Aliarcobacter butzleri TaxID=28197 RepID=UPI0021B4F7A5|nr:nucleotide-binding protein [Aliarcobacter butzleri]MCT7643871.1 nucleotide-binding protein [Aliarcobacter butzleri]